MEMPDLEDEDLEPEPSVMRETPPATSASSPAPKTEPGEDKKKFFKSYG
jgi:hypothetical protein